MANANGGQYETNPGTSDVVADPITLTAPALQVTGVSGPNNADGTQSVLVTWTDTNNGTATATGPWVDYIYLATDAQGDNPTFVGTLTVNGPLAVGASVQLSQQVTLPNTAGTYWFVVTADANRAAPEGTNFSNTPVVAASPIDIAPAELPDLVVTSITPPSNGVFRARRCQSPSSWRIRGQRQRPFRSGTTW